MKDFVKSNDNRIVIYDDFDVGAIFIKSDINLKEYVFADWINRSSKIDRRETNLSLSFCFK